MTAHGLHVRIGIPTSAEFLAKWHAWTHSKVQRHFKRDKSRVPDTVQNVRLRMLKKEFIPRWFFKHLVDELIDRSQVEHMTGFALKRTLIPQIGNWSDPDARWSIKDVLAHIEFDYERYFYSVQNHTLDSDKVLDLLGYEPGLYSALKSLWFQGILQPSELTEHECVRKSDRSLKISDCSICTQGAASLKARGISVASQYDWSLPEVVKKIAKLRWNDSQLAPLLRNWRGSKKVEVPKYVLREDAKRGIDAGLLAYALIIIDNEVVNDFKRLTRNDDIEHTIFNNAKSPEFDNSESVAWDGEDDKETPQRILRDINSHGSFATRECDHDTVRLASRAGLTQDELLVINYVDIKEWNVRDYALKVGKSIQYIHKIRANALRKMRGCDSGNEISEETVDDLFKQTCLKFNINHDELMKGMIGTPVKARTYLFSNLHLRGMGVLQIADEFGVSAEKVISAIGRASRAISQGRIVAAG